MSAIHIVAASVTLLVILAIAVREDLSSHRIPNGLTLGALVLGIALQSYGGGLGGFGLAVAGAIAGLASLLPFYLRKGMGAGDVKLMMAVGSFVGPMNWLGICVLSVIVGGAAGLILVVMSGKLRQTFANMGYILSELVHLRAPYSSRPELDTKSPKALTLPHGAMIAIGVLSFLGAMLMWAPR